MKQYPLDTHVDGGFSEDLRRIEAALQSRRRVLGLLVSGATASVLAGCGGGIAGSSTTSTTAATGSSSNTSSGSSASTACLADPEETNGPFPADGSNTINGTVSNILTSSGIVRSDITSSFGSSTTVASGVPLTLTITLEDSGTACAVLTSYAIYIWHCNEGGEYSLYASDLQNENYLRGVQATDGNGQCTFATIFPACYSGRYPHIHVEVYRTLALATAGSNALLTTQMAMPRDACSAVFGAVAGYSASVANLAAVTTSSDGVFASSTTAQLAQQTPALIGSASAGYVGTITIGVAA